VSGLLVEDRVTISFFDQITKRQCELAVHDGKGERQQRVQILEQQFLKSKLFDPCTVMRITLEIPWNSSFYKLLCHKYLTGMFIAKR